jgi:hypothetical protein
MNTLDTGEIALLIMGGLLVAIIIFFILTRWAHAIEHRKAHDYAQTRLLEEIAREMGVKDETLSAIMQTIPAN